MNRPAFSFEEAVWRELDQMREASQRQADALERVLNRIDQRDEERDSELSDLRLQVGTLRGECKRNLKRDAGLVLAPTTLTAIATALLNWVAQAPPVVHPPPAPISASAPAAEPAAHPTGG